MVEVMMNSIVLVLWRYLKYLQYRMYFSLEQSFDRVFFYILRSTLHVIFPLHGYAVAPQLSPLTRCLGLQFAKLSQLMEFEIHYAESVANFCGTFQGCNIIRDESQYMLGQRVLDQTSFDGGFQ